MLIAIQASPTIALPVFSGIFFVAVGVAYQMGQRRGLDTLHIVFHMGLWGALFYALTSTFAQWTDAPTLVIALGVFSGLTQWGTLTLVGVALRLGPLSPMWCALNLSFVPVTIYSTVIFGETLAPLTILAIGLAIASVLMASMLQTSDSGSNAKQPRSRFAYGVVLFGMLLSNSALLISIKHLEQGTDADGNTLMSGFGSVYYAVMYICMGIPIGLQHLLRRDRLTVSRAGWALGAMAAAGSIGGLGMLGLCDGLPGAVVFTTSAIVALLGAGLASVLVFGERASRLWFAMMIMATLSVILVSV